MDNITLGLAGLVFVAVVYFIWRRTRRKRTIPFEESFKRFMHSKAIIFVLFGLVVNTMLAQAFFNSGGKILISPQFTSAYLILSSVAVTVSLALFELSLVWALNEMRGNTQAGVKYSSGDWRSRIGALAVISLYNAYSIAVLNAFLWPVAGNTAAGGTVAKGVAQTATAIPAPWEIPAFDWIHAALFSLVLFLAGLVGEQRRTSEEEAAVAKDEMLRDLLKKTQEEMAAGTPGPSMTALTALAPDKIRVFFANYANAMSGVIDLRDVVEQMGVEGVIIPREREKDKTSTATDEGEENTRTAAPGHYSNVITLLADHPDLANFKLPGDLDLLTIKPISEMAHALKIRKEDLLTAWRQGGMTPARAPQPGEPHNTISIAVWQTLQLFLDHHINLPPDVIQIAQSVENV